MASEMFPMLEGFSRRAPATDELIAGSERSLGVILPQEYVEFLKLSNGGEGFIGENTYVILWAVEELVAKNADYEVQLNAPGLLIFGSDGGGEALGFDRRTTPYPIVQVPFIGMNWDLACSFGVSFAEFWYRLREQNTGPSKA